MTTERIKEIQDKTAYPHSVSVQQALLQVWNECENLKWIRFEDSRPSIGQEIWIVWPSGTIEPEWRKWTKQMDEADSSDMRWLPIPNYQPEFKP